MPEAVCVDGVTEACLVRLPQNFLFT